MKLVCTTCLLAVSLQAGAGNPASESDFPESLSRISDLHGGHHSDQNNQGINATWYDGATRRYAHGVLGDAIEASILFVKNDSIVTSTELDQDHVFEDIAPRLAFLTNPDQADVITVRSHKDKGAQIAVYALKGNELQLVASTPYIGTSNRWLAPVGVADFNNDGYTDIAYVDRPHLAKTLRVWSYKNGQLEQIAEAGGYSNHRIGEDFISGGIRRCNNQVDMITADAAWRRILITRLIENQLVSEDGGAFHGTESLTKALRCQ